MPFFLQFFNSIAHIFFTGNSISLIKGMKSDFADDPIAKRLRIDIHPVIIQNDEFPV